MAELTQQIRDFLQGFEQICRRTGRSPSDISIVVASKTQGADRIREAQEAGIRAFGENYVQELLQKHGDPALPDIAWHFIGHLQSNKVKHIAPFIAMIQSVDSVSLAKEISRQATKHGRRIDILLQVNTSGETSKSGIAPDAVVHLAREIALFPGIHMRGLMALPEPKDDADEVRPEFRLLRELCKQVREELSLSTFTELSMGMSDDFEIAIEEGATIIRPGTALFGERTRSV